MKIAILPYKSDFPNKYIDRMVEAIKIGYPDAQITSFPTTKNIFSLRGYDYVWLNWFENPSTKSKVKNTFIKIFIIIVLRILDVKIVTTFHNRQPHETTNSLLDRILFYSTFKFSYKIIILSTDSEAILKKRFGKSILKRTVLIPHPTYDCTPKNLGEKNKKFTVLFFGNLRPYKNIELIFELAKIHPETCFTIAGSPLNERYKKELYNKAKGLTNITLIPRFISTEEIDDLINNHTILLLPYDIKSSLNSGVVIHAICKRINVIVPKIGTVNQIHNKNQIFSYSYNSYEEHLDKINQMIKIARDEYENNYDNFERRITILYKEVTQNQNPKIISKKLNQVFI